MINNIKFGHLVDNNLVIPSLPIVHNGISYITIDPSTMLSLGQKEIIYNKKPEENNNGYYKAMYKETETQIIEEWEFIPYNSEELQRHYKEKVVSYIRNEYSSDDEYKILREYLMYNNDDVIKQSFLQYNDFVENCKKQAYDDIYGTKKR